MPPPYQRMPMDRTAHRSRMTNLILRGGDAEAQGRRQQGEIDAQMRSGMANLASSAVRSGVAEFSPEAELRRREMAERSATLDDKARERSRAHNLDGLMQMAGQMPPDEAAALLDQEGYRDEAAHLRQQTNQQRQAARDQAAEQYAAAARNLEQASSLMLSVSRRSTPEAQQAQYAVVVPKVRELLGPKGAAELGVTDDYNADVVAGAAEWTMTAAQTVNHRRQLIQDANLEGRTEEQRLHAGATFLAGLQASEDTQEGWESNIALATAMGVPSSAVEVIGREFTPEAQAKARKLAPPKKASDSRTGDFEALVRTIADRKGRPLTEDELLRARRQWEDAGRAPREPRDPKDGPDLPSLEDIAAYRARVEDSYKRQVTARDNELPSQEQMAVSERWRASELAKLDELERRVKRAGGGMAGIAGQSPRPTTTARPEQIQVPTAVRNAMTKGPGEYGPFSDGSVWRLGRDNRITRIK